MGVVPPAFEMTKGQHGRGHRASPLGLAAGHLDALVSPAQLEHLVGPNRLRVIP